ncbi:hypothetical protein STEG23_003397, partial [Scotinomys teguina]
MSSMGKCFQKVISMCLTYYWNRVLNDTGVLPEQSVADESDNGVVLLIEPFDGDFTQRTENSDIVRLTTKNSITLSKISVCSTT